MKTLILSLVALMAVTSQGYAETTADSEDLKKIVTHSVASDGDAYLTAISEQVSEAPRIENVTVAPKVETGSKTQACARPKIWDAEFFGRR